MIYQNMANGCRQLLAQKNKKGDRRGDAALPPFVSLILPGLFRRLMRAELHRAVSGEAKVALGAQATLVLGNGYGFLHLAQVRIKDGFAVEHDLDGVAFTVTSWVFHSPGFSGTRAWRYHTISTAMVLRRVKLGVFLGGVVEHLQFAHAHVGGVPLPGYRIARPLLPPSGSLISSRTTKSL